MTTENNVSQPANDSTSVDDMQTSQEITARQPTNTTSTQSVSLGNIAPASGGVLPSGGDYVLFENNDKARGTYLTSFSREERDDFEKECKERGVSKGEAEQIVLRKWDEDNFIAKENAYKDEIARLKAQAGEDKIPEPAAAIKNSNFGPQGQPAQVVDYETLLNAPPEVMREFVGKEFCNGNFFSNIPRFAKILKEAFPGKPYF